MTTVCLATTLPAPEPWARTPNSNSSLITGQVRCERFLTDLKLDRVGCTPVSTSPFRQDGAREIRVLVGLELVEQNR